MSARSLGHGPPPFQTSSRCHLQPINIMHSTRALLAKNNLLICLDAFGTLFKPTQPIAATYALAAAKHGIQTGGAENAQQVGSNFAKAFKDESARNPNYGKRTGLGAQAWWENVSCTLRAETDYGTRCRCCNKSCALSENDKHYLGATELSCLISRLFQRFVAQ